jgi:hypothetical protein
VVFTSLLASAGGDSDLADVITSRLDQLDESENGEIAKDLFDLGGWQRLNWL